MNERLIWNEEGRKTVFTCSVFSVGERYCRSQDGKLKTFSVLDTSDWAMVIPVLETERGKEFIMVRQWRHGAGELSLEFPGGVFEKGENPSVAASRELLEETGYTPGKIEKLRAFNPNPAIMSNTIHFFLASDLQAPAKQDLDDDEYIDIVTVPWKEALQGLGNPPYIHALTGTAMALYMQKNSLTT